MPPSPNQRDPETSGARSLSLLRRDFLGTAGLGLAGLMLSGDVAWAGVEDLAKLVPEDKGFSPEWIASLTARGVPETCTGDDLRFIGMPVGGLCAGTLYLGGDGKLWLWDIFNRVAEGIVPKVVTYAGARLSSSGGSAYVEPPEQQGPVDQGFALRVGSAGAEMTKTLDRRGFRDVGFRGQYPIGTVTYRDPEVPVSATLEAFSPFIPLDVEDSSLPATVMSFTLRNESPAAVEVTLFGWLENAVCHGNRFHAGTRLNRIVDGEESTLLLASAAKPAQPGVPDRPDIVFEDWSKDTYEGWTVAGDAFGQGPIRKRDIPGYQGDVGGPGTRVVNSHATAPGGGVKEKDDRIGNLTCRPFQIERAFIHLWVGGGSHEHKTCVNLRVDGKVVRSATGPGNNRMELQTMDVRRFLGKDAVLEIVDDAKGGWGNVGVGRITFSDAPATGTVLEDLPDFGTMALTLLGPPAEYRHAEAGEHGKGGEAGDRAEADLGAKLVGAIGRTLKLEPGREATVPFVVTWHFGNLNLRGMTGRYYARRFDSAAAVARFVTKDYDRLSSLTRLWHDTWYDSTLPYWFLNRTFANTSTLATTTCYRFGDGRFWAWEGVGACEGTCTHVWQYAQAMGRIFPELERGLRERVDFGLAFDAKTGVIGFRGEHTNFAADGQAGTILRAYREHQMSPDSAFLERNWPRIKRALQLFIDRDRDKSGILYGPMHNTLDADWYGVVPWLVGLYHAALRAGEEMAREVGDEAFASTCRAIFEKGLRSLDAQTWNETYGYYVQVADPKHPEVVGSYRGCHIDQVYGQSWAFQVGLGRVMDGEHVKRALKSLWKYNVAPDVGPYRQANRPGRWYAMPGEGGMLMVTFPFGRPKSVGGAGAWSAMYFNECMTGFEWQVAGHMIWERLVTEGLAVARLIHDRYSARLRNPYNEIECSDHYARAMASYGAFLAACGFEYNGPKGHIGFAPRLTPDDFRAPFTSAEGWGAYSQARKDGRLAASICPKYGHVRLRTVALELPEGAKAGAVEATANGENLVATLTQSGSRVVASFAQDVKIDAGQAIELAVRYSG